MFPDRRVVLGRHTCSVEDNRVGDVAGARWKRFLLARATVLGREAARPGKVLAGKWRAGY
jgi:hypothetical protein